MSGVPDIGLTTLFPRNDICHFERPIDIVAVHGLNGDRISSWADPGTGAQWLEELQKRLPSSCVMTFGYDCEMSSTEIITVEGIREIALRLLKDITDVRKVAELAGLEKSPPASLAESNSRPLVFIGHNLGGTIIKQALSIANFENQYLPIAADTCLLVFFGTPHRADSFSGVKGWKTLTANIAAASLHKPRELLSERIARSAQALMDLSSDFLPFSETVSILNFYEEDDSGAEVVGEWPVTLNISTDFNYPLSGNHLSLCRPRSDDSQIDCICMQISESITNPPKFDKLKIDCLQTLSTLNPEIYIPTIPGPESVYSSWLFSNPVYQSWIKSTAGILFLHRGFGGSVLSSLALKETRASNFGEGKATIFFFCDKLDERRSSTREVLLSLIRQLLVQQPSLFHHALSLYDRTKGGPGWTVQQLLVLFRVLLCSREKIQIMCVIDALDTCDSGSLDLFSELIDAVETTDKTESPLRFIITTRSSPDSFIPLATKCCFHLDLDDLEVQRKIHDDVRCVLEIGVADLIQRRPEFSGLQESITAKFFDSQDSTFITADLTLGELGSLDVPSTRFSIGERLESLKFGSQEVYERQLHSISSDWQSWASEVLSWLLCAVRPLAIDELAIALAIKTNSKSLGSIEDHISRNMVGDLERVLGSFISISNREVHLTHSTAKEFLLSQNGGDTWYDFNLEQAYEHISQICLTYLSMEEFKDADTSCLPYSLGSRSLSQSEWGFLTYAARNWPQHYRQVGGQSSDIHLAVSDFINEQVLLGFWPKLYHSLVTPKTPTAWVSALQIACDLGFGEVIELLETIIDGDRAIEALERAAGAGHEYIVRQLLEAGIDVQKPEILNIAAQNGHESVVTLLLESGCSPENADENDESPLILAAENGHTTVVKKLLAAGNIPQPRTGMSLALLRAAENGYHAVVKELLMAHADVQASGIEKWSPLHLAAQGGHAAAAKELLHGGASPQPHRPKLTPLHRAAQAGNHHIAKQILVSDEVDVDPRDHTLSTPLHYAAQHGHQSVVNLLLAHRADRSLADRSNGNTPLHLAAINGHLLVIELFVGGGDDDSEEDESDNDEDKDDDEGEGGDNGDEDEDGEDEDEGDGGEDGEDSDENEDDDHEDEDSEVESDEEDGIEIDKRNLDGNTALHLACYAGNYLAAVLLVSADADIDATNSAGDTPLHLAAYMGHSDTVSLLVGYDADLSIENTDGESPLDVAYINGHYELLKDPANDGEAPKLPETPPLHCAVNRGYLGILRQQLLDDSLDVDAQNEDGWTALHFGVRSGREEEIKLLLQAGADIDAKNHRGSTPLLLAADLGQQAIVKLLLDNGANPLRTNRKGYTALHRACRNGHLGVVRLLVHAGADPEIQTDLEIERGTGLTPQDMAPDLRREVVEKALERRVNGDANFYDKNNINLLDKKGRTKLFYTCADGLEIPTKSLLEAGADPEIRDIDGRTPLDLALKPRIRALILESIGTRDTAKPRDGAPLCKSLYCQGYVCDSCDKSVNNSFYYHCCLCSDDDYDICSTCYDNGVRCTDAEHTLRVRFNKDGISSFSEYSPWVSTRRTPLAEPESEEE